MPDRIEVRNPFTGYVIDVVPLATAGEIDRAIESAHVAFESYRREPAFRRAHWLTSIASLLESRKGQFANSIVAEAGKPVALAEAEVNRAVWTFTSAADEARRFHGDTFSADAFPSGEGHVGLARRFPVGVVYGITPFNFPLNLAAHKIAPALACGCSILVKPSPKAPLTPRLLVELIQEAADGLKLSRDVVQLIVTTNENAMRPIADARIRHVSFTGSVPVGWQINELAAKCRKRATLELGGNAGCIVHADADLAKAIPMIAAGAFAYAGQSCISVQRLFVHESIYEPFARDFVAHVEQKVKCGDPTSRDVIVGPMIEPAARDRVLKSIEAAKGAGAKVLTGGRADGPCVVPTVLADASPDLDVCAKEIFAPVVVLSRYGDFDDALNRVNSSPFGLQAGVFTNDINLILRAHERLEVGGVMINQVPTFRLENMPYGGVKDSGVAREGVRYAMEEMTELRTLVIRR